MATKKQPSFSIPIKKAGADPTAQYHRMCVTALTGAGKTVLGTTAPRPLIMVAESISKPTIQAFNPEAYVIEVTSRDEIMKVLEWARSSEEARHFATLVVDSATECGEILKKWVVENSPTRAKMEAMGKFNVLTLDDWGTYYSELDRMMRMFTTLPMHTLCLAQAFEQVDEVSRARFLRPNFEGSKFPPRFPGYFSLSGVLERVPSADGKSVERRVVFDTPGSMYLTKTAKGLDDVEPANVARWIEKLNAAKKK